MKRLVIIGIGLAPLAVLSACGAAREIKPAAGKPLPVAPYGAAATPSPDELLTASTQARPERSDEVLTSSVERQGNEFDLPPAK